MNAPNGTPPSPLTAAAGWCRRERHFLLAAVVLGASAAGWSALVELMGIVTWKAPVPWPPPVAVNEEYRMVSLPERLGPFELVTADGELEKDDAGEPIRDGRPDGERKLTEDVLESLKIGTASDRANRPKRCSNWFMVRTYRDNRPLEPGGATFRYWSAEAYYYTGGVDPVPHVPEICLDAGGAQAIEPVEVEFDIPSLPAPWNRPFRMKRVIYRVPTAQGLRPMVQYYVFSLNGRPTNSRYAVRLELTNPFVKYAYFAKIQFSPRAFILDPELADRAAREFARHYLPEILRMMPMPEDIEALEQKS